MAKIQKRGHCPHCGREQAVRPGGMAHHGYEVTYGYFSGTCSGAGLQPIEYETGKAAAIARAKWLAEEGARFMALEWTEPLMGKAGSRWNSRAGKHEDVFKPWAELTERQRIEAKASWEAATKRSAMAYKDLSDWLVKMILEYAGKPLREVDLEPDSKTIKAGDVVRCYGYEGPVIRIEDKCASGCGPNLNGKWMPHVVLMDGGREVSIPKRFARKVGA